MVQMILARREAVAMTDKGEVWALREFSAASCGVLDFISSSLSPLGAKAQSKFNAGLEGLLHPLAGGRR